MAAGLGLGSQQQPGTQVSLGGASDLLSVGGQLGVCSLLRASSGRFPAHLAPRSRVEEPCDLRDQGSCVAGPRAASGHAQMQEGWWPQVTQVRVASVLSTLWWSIFNVSAAFTS